MAPVLVCPDCSTKHPLSTIGERRAFPCEGCGRTLKVPEAAAAAAVASGAVRTAAAPSAPAPAPLPAEPFAVEPEPATRVMPMAEPPMPMPMPEMTPAAAVPRERPKRDPIPPRGIRFLLWIVAIPLAFIVVIVFAKAAGMLTTNEISDVALAEGWGRFWPIARLIPFVAFAAALFVQGGALLLTRIRERRWAEQDRAAALKAAGPGTNGSRPRGQSSRTRA